MTVITNKYRSDTSRLFFEDVSINDYYLFISSTANTSVLNTNKSKMDFLEKTLFGKRIDPDDVFYMIKNYPWESDLVYDQYDDSVEMTNKRYYAVVYPENNETGDYRVYKCLFNNYGSKSINPPNYSLSTPNQIYAMADGYIWKFMYSITELQFDKYITRGYIPIIDANTTFVDETSEINQIFVENPEDNKGYEQLTGSVYIVQDNDVIITVTGGNFNAVENYYSGYSLYVTYGGDSQVYEIDTYEKISSTQGVITLVGGIPNDGVLVNSSSFFILPRVEIRGDGTGASAIPVLSETGSIVRIAVLNPGSGYKNAIAYVPDPYAFDSVNLGSLNQKVILRTVLSPPGGHGTNLVDELSCRHVLTYVNFTEFDNDVIPTTNSFASVGIVKNPEFKVFPNPNIFDNRIELSLDDHTLSTNEIITQIETDINSEFYNEIRFSGKVHEVSNNFIYVCEYMGPYPNDVVSYANTDFSDISLKIDLPIRSSENQIFNINTDNNPEYPVEYDIGYPGFRLSPYIQRTGDVYYMNRFVSVTRTENSREQFKILLEF